MDLCFVVYRISLFVHRIVGQNSAIPYVEASGTSLRVGCPASSLASGLVDRSHTGCERWMAGTVYTAVRMHALPMLGPVCVATALTLTKAVEIQKILPTAPY